MDQFESFETKRFVQRLLGKGDVSGLMDKIQVGAVVGGRAYPALTEVGWRYGGLACHGQKPGWARGG